MQKALAKLTRQNHQKHIVDVMPLITAVFGVQCYLMEQFDSGIDTGNLALYMGLGLVSFVTGLFWYDKNHHIIIFEDRIECGFFGFGAVKTIDLKQIEKIIAPKDEKNFSSLALRMKDGSSHIFHFVDYPNASKDFINQQIQKLKEEVDTPIAA